MRWVAFAALAMGSLAACGSGEQADPQVAAEAAVAARQAEAEDAFSMARFDTISWKADSVAHNRGAVVWMYSCQKCHGMNGQGDGGFVQRGDTLHPPDFLDPNWMPGEDHAELLRLISVGRDGRMPHWGMEEQFKARDIDAVAWYIQEVLRRGVDPDRGM